MPFKKDDPNINRAGRPPKGNTWTDILKEQGDQEHESGMSFREAVAKEAYKKALEGDSTARAFIAGYEQGKPIETVRTQEIDNEPIEIIRRK